MPCYFFDIHDHGAVPDYEGQELPDMDAARVQAVRFSADYLHDNPAVMWDGREIRAVVRNEDGQPVMTIITLAVPAP